METTETTKVIYPSHPYMPKSLKLPHYVANDKSVWELLGVFFGVVSVFVGFIWFYSGTKRPFKTDMLARFKLCWFMACAIIHTILEGYFSFFHKTLAGEQTFLAQMWKEYGRGDSRYISSDTFTVCMEQITSVIDGPLAFLAVYAFLSRAPYRYVVQLILSCFQLYGDVLYYMTEVKEGFSHGELWHPLYFWFYFVFLNALWIVIPLLCIGESCVQMSKSQCVADNQGPGGNDNKGGTRKVKKQQ